MEKCCSTTRKNQIQKDTNITMQKETDMTMTDMITLMTRRSDGLSDVSAGHYILYHLIIGNCL